ncbi:MAG: hypothetical protein IJN16_04070 [Lachnospiraceae bacterium]|nr:hypothetical protein [Lachnospiraceae bacterium]
MQTLYTNIKVNNEIELCEILDGESKVRIEKALLQNRISYFIRWQRRGFFRKRNFCIICVHDDVKEAAAEIVQAVCDEMGYYVKFLFKKARNDYL